MNPLTMPQPLAMGGLHQSLVLPTRSGSARALRGLLVGTAIVATVLAARSAGLLQGGFAFAVLVLGCLSVPTSRHLSRRILIAGAAGLGWAPLAWWFPAPLPSLGRMSLILALLLGGLGAWVASGRSPRARFVSFVPRLHPVDVLPFVSAILSAAAVSDLLTARTGSRVLTLLIPGWDSISHYGMVHLIRVAGAVSNPTPWTTSGAITPFSHYPQGFHAAVAATMELLTSPAVGSTDHELVLYVRAVALVVIVAVTALVAGICALPRLRRRPAVAAPLVAIVTAGFVSGPGATAMRDGFPNFVLACALVGIVVVLVVPLERVVSPILLGAIGGAIVGIAYSWALLLVLALLALCALVVPVSRARWAASPRQWLAASAIVLAVVISCLAALNVLSAIPLATQLTVPGGVTPPPIGLFITIVLGSAGLTIAVFGQARRAPNGAVGGTASRTATLFLVPVGGVLIALAIVVLELRAASTISYYFWKFAVGLELTCLVVAAAAVAALVTARPRTSSTRLSRTVAVAASGLLVVAASQAFGYFGPQLAHYGVTQEDSTTQQRESAQQLAMTPNSTGVRLLAALPVLERNPKRQVFFMPYPPDVRTHPILAEQWFLSLSGTFTEQNQEVAKAVGLVSSARSAATWATVILRGHPNRLIVVDPQVLGDVRMGMDPAYRRQIVSW